MKKNISALLCIITICFCCCNIEATDLSVYAVKAIADSKILPDTLLPSSLLSDAVCLTACRGEYEPASFVVKSSEAVSGLSVSVQSPGLSRVGGSETIPVSNVDIRVVKCWYQAGYAVWDLTHKHLTPELLLKDDSLVNVTGTENYLKLSPEGDDPYYTCISTPASGSGMAILSFTEFPVIDNDNLQPVDLVPGENKQFWITVKVPDTATAGTYTGNINLSATGVSKTIKVTVEVPDINLEQPCLTYSLYYRGLLKTTGSISSEDKNEEQFTAEMQNLVAHGVTNPTVYGQGSDTVLGNVLTIRNNVGLSNSNLYYLGLRVDSYGNNLDSLRSMVTSKINFVSSYGINQLYIYGIDEQSLDTTEHRAQIAAVHEVGGKVFNAQSLTYANAIYDVLDLCVISYYIDSNLADSYHANGNNVFSYSNPQVGEDNPETYRRNYGIWLWQNHYDGVMDYAYQHSFCNIWNDFDDANWRDHNFTYPTMNGVIDTMAWEGFREAIDDVRYLTTLNTKIDTVMAGSNEYLKTFAKDAKAWLSTVNVNGDLDSIRSKIRQYILNLDGNIVVGQWHLDEVSGSSVASDSSGNNNIGTLTNMNPGTAWVDGRIGGGITLNRANYEYINCGSSASLNILNAITVAAWVYSPDATSQLVYCRDTTNGPRFRINVNNSSAINLWVRTNNQGWHLGGIGGTHDWTGWHHVAWTYDSANNTTKFYFDGVEDYSSATISTGALAAGPLQYFRIGGGENSTYFSGGIDEFKVYNQALSGNEIEDLYNSSNLRGAWSFSESAESNYASDSSGNNNVGTLTNMSPDNAWVDGKIGGGIALNRASNEYIDCGNSASLNILNAITVAAWVYSPDATSQLVYCRDTTNGPRFRINVNNSSAINLWVRTNNQGWHLGGIGGTHNWTGWHHVAWTYDSANSTTKFYFDGVEDYSSATVSTGALAGGSLQYFRIGGGENNTYFSGRIDEFKVYSQALSGDEIKNIYNSSNLCGAWSFNESAGSNYASDSSGNNHTGALTNMNANTAWCAGKIGNALTFDGAGYVDCGTSVSFDMYNYTITGWTKPTTSGAMYRRIVQRGNGTVGFLMQLWDNNKIYIYQGIGGVSKQVSAAFPHDNNYHHVAMVFSYDGANSTLKLYIDGTQQGTPVVYAGAPDFPDATTKLLIGNGNFQGQLDEFKIYGKALTEAEVNQDMNYVP